MDKYILAVAEALNHADQSFFRFEKEIYSDNSKIVTVHAPSGMLICTYSDWDGSKSVHFEVGYEPTFFFAQRKLYQAFDSFVRCA